MKCGRNMKESKVKVAIYDADLRVKIIKHYPLSSGGTKIKIKSGGDGHFMPTIGTGDYLEWPKRSLIPPFRRTWERVYIVKNNGAKPVNFETEEVFGIDTQDIIDAANAEIIRNFGKEKKETPVIMYIIILMLLAIAGKIFGVIV